MIQNFLLGQDYDAGYKDGKGRPRVGGHRPEWSLANVQREPPRRYRAASAPVTGRTPRAYVDSAEIGTKPHPNRRRHLTTFFQNLTHTTPLNVDDLIVYRSDRSGVAELSVTIHEFPADVPWTIVPKQGAYAFWYRPRTEKGDTRVTVPELGLSRHRISCDHVLLFPPSLPVHGEWQRAGSRLARFSFSPPFFEAMAAQVGLPQPGLKAAWHAFFSIDQRLEALCRLLMEETEGQCPHGPLYFESLARALAVGVLSSVRDPHPCGARAAAVPPGIRRAIKTLETNFADGLSLAELAAQAQLSRSHFTQAFQQLTGLPPHQYLLRVRLSHARKLLAQENGAMPLTEIAVACGFCDQAHLSRHFRRAFGTTPAAFRHRHRRP